jgi:uncharacterized oxidoreductase
MPVIQHPILNDLIYRIFQATDIPEADAHIVADHLVNSHLYGHDSHGTWFAPGYARGMKKNYPRWEDHEVLRDTPVLRIINAKGANGIVSVTHALDIAVEKAKQSTFGFVGLNHTTHIGRLGDYPPRIAEQGMIGMVWLNGGGVFLAPFGSADRRLRPEPIAFSAPRKNGPPFMLDMTMTVVAGGKIEQKNIRGEKMPPGWVIDQQGHDVTDPARYKAEPENTGVLPLGGKQFGHKGYGLGMMVEMLVGPLSHAGCTKDAKGSGGGVMILVINIEDFIDLASYEEEVESLAEWVSSARPLPGINKVYTPGEIEQEAYARLSKEGIDLPEPTWQAIGEVAAELGVEMPGL